MSDAISCAYAPCTCLVEADGAFCSPTCRLGLGVVTEPCECGHAACTASDGRA